MGDFNLSHPELKEGEVFLENAGAGRFRRLKWKTKRQGRITYDHFGNRYFDFKYPVFVQKSELDAAGYDPSKARRRSLVLLLLWLAIGFAALAVVLFS